MTKPGWRTGHLGEVVAAILDFRGRTPKKLGMDWGGGDIPALSAVNVRAGGVDLSRTSHFGSEALYERWMTQGDTARGDVLITTEAPLGNIAQVPDDRKYILSQRVILLKPRSDVIDPTFLAQQMRGAVFQSLLDDHRSGTTATGIRQSRLVTVPVQVPPLNEQRRIVAKLEALQARSRRAREALDAVPQLLEKLRQSILAAAFRGDLTKDWRAKHKDVEPASELLKRIRSERRKKWEDAELAKMKAKGKAPPDDKWKAKYKESEPVQTTGLLQLPEGWCWASVEEVGLIESGQTTDGLAEHASSAFRDVPWFRVGDMNHKDNELAMRVSEVWLSSEDVRRFGLHVRPEGTIVFPKRGGAIATNKKRRLAQPSTYDLNTMGIVPIDSFADYIWVWLQTIDLGRLNTGTSVPQINHGDIAPLPVPVPPHAEAKLIGERALAYLAALRQSASGLVGMGARLAELDRASLAKAFRGQLVPQDPNDEPAQAMISRAHGRDGAITNAAGQGRRSKANAKRAVE